MESLLFLVTTILVEAYKWANNKFGKKVTDWSIYLGVGILSLAWTYLTKEEILTRDSMMYFMEMVLAAVGTYEVVLKWLVKKVMAEQARKAVIGVKLLAGKFKK